MKKFIVSLVALVATMTVSAQTPGQKTLLAASKLSDAMRSDSIRSATITSSEAGTPENFKPRKPSPPAKRTGTGASGTAKTATGGAPKNIGDTLALPNGKVLILCEDGELHERGEVLEDSDGNRFEVKADGTIRFKSGPPPANNNAASNGMTLVQKLDDFYDTIPANSRLVVAGNLRIVEPGSGASGGGAGTVSSLPAGFTQLPNGVVIQKEKVNGVETRIAWFPDGSYAHLDGNAELAKITLNGTDFFSSGGEVEAGGKRNSYKYGMREAAGHTGQYYRRGAGTVLAGVANTLVGATGVTVGVGGATCGQTVVYNQRPPAVATYGTRGGDCWRARAVWNRGR